MTVTKQQQLEWLVKEFAVWPGFGGVPIRMSSVTIGEVNNGLGVAHHIRMEEWQQERDKISSRPEVDSSWHERGELPPVGCAVDVTGDDVAYGYGESCCEVLAHVEGCAVIRMSFGLGCFVAKVLSPSRTEREKAIDALIEIICAGGELSKDGSVSREIAERIYDAGILK